MSLFRLAAARAISQRCLPSIVARPAWGLTRSVVVIEKPIGVRSFHLTSWRGQSAVEDKDQDLPEEGAQDVANDAQLASHDESKVENSSADAQGVGAKTPEAAATARSPFRERSRNLSGRTKSLGEAPPDSKILYVGNLNFDLSSEELADTFREIGEVVNARIVQDYKGLSKGFGYIEFADREKAHAAIRSLDQTELQGRRMAVQFHIPRVKGARPSPGRGMGPTTSLFIGNLNFQMTDQDLNGLFRSLNDVTDVRVAIDRRSGQPRGFAHADFTDVAAAERAKKELEGKEYFGRQLRIDFATPQMPERQGKFNRKSDRESGYPE